MNMLMRRRALLCALTLCIISLIVSNPFVTLIMVHASCSNTCGDTPITYPFGTGSGCGSKLFQSYTKCSKGKFILTTHAGQYEVSHIDYLNKILIVSDKKMSTCSAMRRTTSTGFGLQPGTPFTVQGPHIVLLACISPSSIVQNSHSSICDASGEQVCQDLYRYCPSVTNLGLSVNSAIRSCCVLSMTTLDGTSSIGIDPKNYGCLSYTSIYRFGSGQGFSTDYQNPNTWSYGIPLHYNYDEASLPVGCRECEASKGSCAFDDSSNFVCVCSSTFNTTGTCPPGTTSNRAVTNMNILFTILVTVLSLVACIF